MPPSQHATLCTTRWHAALSACHPVHYNEACRPLSRPPCALPCSMPPYAQCPRMRALAPPRSDAHVYPLMFPVCSFCADSHCSRNARRRGRVSARARPAHAHGAAATAQPRVARNTRERRWVGMATPTSTVFCTVAMHARVELLSPAPSSSSSSCPFRRLLLLLYAYFVISCSFAAFLLTSIVQRRYGAARH